MPTVRCSKKAYEEIKGGDGNNMREKLDNLLFGRDTSLDEDDVRDIVRDEVSRISRGL